MRVLFVSDFFPPETNAQASRLYEHAKRWVAQGAEVTVLTCAPNFPGGKLFTGYANKWRQVENKDGIRVVRVKTYIAPNVGLVRRVLDHVSFLVSASIFGAFEGRPDVIVASSPTFLCAVAGCIVAALRRKPFIMEVRDLWPDSIVAVGVLKEGAIIRLLRRLELFLYRRAALIVVVTQRFKTNLVSRGIAPHRIAVIYNGADLSWCRPTPRDPRFDSEFETEGKFTVGYFGTLGLAHDLEKVIEAAGRLLDAPEVRFVFVGAGARADELQRIAAERRLHNVTFGRAKPKADMSRLWSICDLAIIPLRDHPVFAEVIPSKLFEAMGHGVPVLMAMPTGEATGIVETSQCGICVAPGDAGAIATAIRRLASDPKQVSKLRQAAVAAAAAYSREVQAQYMLEAIEAAKDTFLNISGSPMCDQVL
jgi:glycosyltransferase involved in cell wall biosynthesis